MRPESLDFLRRIADAPSPSGYEQPAARLYRAYTEPFADRFATLPERAVTLDAVARDARLAACAAYRSQLGYQFGGPEALRAKLDLAGPIETLNGLPLPDLGS